MAKGKKGRKGRERENVRACICNRERETERERRWEKGREGERESGEAIEGVTREQNGKYFVSRTRVEGKPAE